MVPWGSATPSFAAPISRGGGSTTSRKSRGGGSAGAAGGVGPGPGISAAAKAARGVPNAASARNPSASARGSGDSAIRPRRSQTQTALGPEGGDALSNTSEAIDGHAATEIATEDTSTLGDGDGAAAEDTDGVQNRDALAAAMDAERRQLAEMFDEIDASATSATFEAVALANAEDETNELEQNVQQLKQSIASIKSPKGSKFPRAAGGDAGSDVSTELSPPRMGSSHSAESIAGVQGVHGLSDAFNYGQATHGGNAIGSGRGVARGGSQAQQGRNAKQRLNSIKSKQGGVSNMPPMFGMRPKSKQAGTSNLARRTGGRRGEQGLSARDGFNATASLDDLRSSHDSNESSGAKSTKPGDASGPRRVALKQLKSQGDATRRGGLPPGARVHQLGKQGRGPVPHARSRAARSRSDNFAFPIST